jgi:hypothetical protein
MTHVYRKVKQSAELLEKLELAIPGYRGYKEKELRREADRLIREHLLKMLEPAYRDFKSSMLNAAGDTALMQTYNQVQALFDRVIAKLRTASYGYSGFFDAVKIREAELDKLLEYDWNLVSTVERLAKLAREAAASEPAKLGEALSSLRGELLALEDLLRKREEILRGAAGES